MLDLKVGDMFAVQGASFALNYYSLWRVERFTPKQIVASRFESNHVEERFKRDNGSMVGKSHLRLTTSPEIMKRAARAYARHKYCRGYYISGLVTAAHSHSPFTYMKNSAKAAQDLTLAEIRDIKRACRAIVLAGQHEKAYVRNKP